VKPKQQESEYWRKYPDKTFIFLFSDVRGASNEKLSTIWTEQCQARIGESSALYAAYDGPPKNGKRLRVEKDLSTLCDWTKSRLSDSHLPNLDADHVYFIAVPSAEYLIDPKREKALPLMPWIEEMKSLLPRVQKDLADDIFRNAIGTHNAEAFEAAPGPSRPEIMAPPAGPADSKDLHENTFVRKGDVWTISYDDESVQLPHAVGLGYVAILLQNPGREIRCLAIYACSSARRPTIQVQRADDVIRPETEVIQDGDSFVDRAISNTSDHGDTAFDEQARKDYERKARELEKDIKEARKDGRTWEADEKLEELQAISDYVRLNTNRRGRPRKLGDDDEKARITVTSAITRAIESLEQVAPKTATHLRVNIKTGTRAIYRDTSTPWKCKSFMLR
jgi:hypothetical protein